MSQATPQLTVYRFNGQSISMLKLTNETEVQLCSLDIATLEQLAKLALNAAGKREQELIAAIRRELQARLDPYSVNCYAAGSYAAHLIISAEGLFFFRASAIPDDDDSWNCIYQWQVDAELASMHNMLVPFHIPHPAISSITPDTGHLADEALLVTYANGGSECIDERFITQYKTDKEAVEEPKVQLGLNKTMLTQQSGQRDILSGTFEEILSPLIERERRVIELRFGTQDGDRRTLEAVGNIFSCTRAWISQIEQKALRKLRASHLPQRVQELLIPLETALEKADGVLSIAMALHKLGCTQVTDEHDLQIAEARLRFLLGFSDAIEIPKNTTLVVWRRKLGVNVAGVLPVACEMLQRILRKATHPLSIEEILSWLESIPRGHEIVARVPKSTLVACLIALPQVTSDNQGRYYLVGRTFDPPPSVSQQQVHTTSLLRVREFADQACFESERTSLTDREANVLQRPEQAWESYDVWNHAIATYVTAGVQRGSTVYLSVDDEVIEQISRRLHYQEEVAPEAFLTVVQRRVVQGRRVVLEQIQGRNRHGEPNCVAFLASMVLAALRMAEDENEEIASSNYFTRFCEVLELDQDGGRPLGMKAGAEEPLWREWIVWLGENGLISSARPGEGATRYINYPISQALLRGADRDRLRRLFTESKWGDGWDTHTLMTAMRREASRLSTHLRTLLEDQSQRAQAIAEAIYEVYEAWGSGDTSSQTGGQAYGYNLLADLWRSEDLLSGAIEYFLYPRSPRRQQFDSVVVNIDGQLHILIPERPGWYMPVYEINEQHLNQGVRFPIEQPEELETLVLLRHAFWILSPDPNNPESGVYASWKDLPLGIRFIILCRRELLPDLNKLHTERLIEWSGEPQPVQSFSDWVEIVDCMVISPTWDGVEIENRDLHDALRPKERLSIGLSGGLRTSQDGWLTSLGPQVTIFGFPREADVRIIRISDNQTIFEETRPTNRSFEVIWSTPGDYLVEAVAESRMSQRLVKIVDWDDLETAPTQDLERLQIGEVHLCGALISVAGEGEQHATLV
ncbi:MAG: hypothetical protein MI924_03330 [Chloroflexales bacterium]|nr:hypothetical protein [Chloroflexales bacterium]